MDECHAQGLPVVLSQQHVGVLCIEGRAERRHDALFGVARRREVAQGPLNFFQFSPEREHDVYVVRRRGAHAEHERRI